MTIMPQVIDPRLLRVGQKIIVEGQETVITELTTSGSPTRVSISPPVVVSDIRYTTDWVYTHPITKVVDPLYFSNLEENLDFKDFKRDDYLILESYGGVLSFEDAAYCRGLLYEEFFELCKCQEVGIRDFLIAPRKSYLERFPETIIEEY